MSTGTKGKFAPRLPGSRIIACPSTRQCLHQLGQHVQAGGLGIAGLFQDDAGGLGLGIGLDGVSLERRRFLSKGGIDGVPVDWTEPRVMAGSESSGENRTDCC